MTRLSGHVWVGGLVLCLAGCSELLKFDEVSFDDAGAGASDGAGGGSDGVGGAADGVGGTADGVGGATNNVGGAAGEPDQDGCAPVSCEGAAAECGTIDDKCGGTLDCGTCSQPSATCQANKCSCDPATCASAGYECGPLSDGCGNTLSCGDCTPGEVCGGDGTPHKCSPPTGHHETKTEPGATGGETDGQIPVCCVPSSEEKALIMEAFDLLNQHRASKGVAALVYDDKLEAAIEGHCHHMAAHDFWGHKAPESSVSSFGTRASLCGASASAENIAAGQGTAQGVMQSWIGSPGHNANMLNAGYTRVGIGYYKGGSWGSYWGQLFR